jgi:hypothetical protein
MVSDVDKTVLDCRHGSQPIKVGRDGKLPKQRAGKNLPNPNAAGVTVTMCEVAGMRIEHE